MQKLREIRDKINLEIQDMTIEEMKSRFKNQKRLLLASHWKKKD